MAATVRETQYSKLVPMADREQTSNGKCEEVTFVLEDKQEAEEPGSKWRIAEVLMWRPKVRPQFVDC